MHVGCTARKPRVWECLTRRPAFVVRVAASVEVHWGPGHQGPPDHATRVAVHGLSSVWLRWTIRSAHTAVSWTDALFLPLSLPSGHWGSSLVVGQPCEGQSITSCETSPRARWPWRRDDARGDLSEPWGISEAPTTNVTRSVDLSRGPQPGHLPSAAAISHPPFGSLLSGRRTALRGPKEGTKLECSTAPSPRVAMRLAIRW